jgi:hypothetical protein
MSHGARFADVQRRASPHLPICPSNGPPRSRWSSTSWPPKASGSRSAVAPGSGGSNDRVMDRRAFLGALAGGLLAAPLAAEAQPAAKVPRIGFLTGNLAASPHVVEAFRQGLRDLGYIEGRNVVIEYRDAEGTFERLPARAAELVALKVDVIVAGGTPQALAAKQATRTVPMSSRLLATRLPADSSPALRGRAAMSRGSPASARSWSARVWNGSRRPFRGSAGSQSSGSQVARGKARIKRY